MASYNVAARQCNSILYDAHSHQIHQLGVDMAKVSKIIVDSAKLDAAIVEMSKRASSVADMIQVVLASAVFQAVAHGNTNQLNAVVHAAGRGARKTAIAQWALAHGPVVSETDKDKAKENPFRFNKDKLQSILDGYEGERSEIALVHAELIFAQHWTEHKEPPLVPETWDALAAIRKLLTQGAGYEKKGTKVLNPAILASIAAILPSASDGISGV
jgi:hypothetical protein